MDMTPLYHLVLAEVTLGISSGNLVPTLPLSPPEVTLGIGLGHLVDLWTMGCILTEHLRRHTGERQEHMSHPLLASPPR